MLNLIWPIFIIISFTYGIFSGRVNEINSGIFSSTEEAVQLCINLLRNNMLMEWNYADSGENKTCYWIDKIAEPRY